MVDSLRLSLEGWDPSYKKKILSSANEEQIIDRWIATVETNNKEYPYILKAPKIAEVLSWLSTHPLLDQLKKEEDPIHIQELHYQLLKFPKIGSTKEPYQAKVEIEFRFNSAINARKFHEALLKGDTVVDPALEVTWETLHDGYRTSFFLKNRSAHVY
jgi:hypothetical protein